MKILKRGNRLQTILLAGVSKEVSERLIAMSPLGNGNLVSGIAKILIASFIPSGKYSSAVALGIGVDGVEDIITTILGAGAVNQTNVI